MKQLNGKTEVYGIMGKPVTHSLSPAMHNAAFAALALNKIYVPFEVDDVANALTGFKALGIKGVSVTIPHKQTVLTHLDSIDPVAAKIGAVNTLIISQQHIHGINTDWLGANRALTVHLALKNKKILLLGSGGSARAIGFGLLEAGAQIIIASRTPAKGQKLAEKLLCEWHPLAEAAQLSADALINATSVGMIPNIDLSPVPAIILHNFPVVMDIVYAPLATKLLIDAQQAGCKIIDGLSMLLYQGAAQFEIWTEQEAPVDLMRQQLLKKLIITGRARIK